MARLSEFLDLFAHNPGGISPPRAGRLLIIGDDELVVDVPVRDLRLAATVAEVVSGAREEDIVIVDLAHLGADGISDVRLAHELWMTGYRTGALVVGVAPASEVSLGAAGRGSTAHLQYPDFVAVDANGPVAIKNRYGPQHL